MRVQFDREVIPVDEIKVEEISEKTPYVECSQDGPSVGIDETTARFLREPKRVFVMFDDGRVVLVLAQLFGKTLACMSLPFAREPEVVDCHLWPGSN